MKKIFFFLIAFWAFNFGSVIADEKIVTIQNISIKPFTEALDGFKSICSSPVIQILASELGKIDIQKEVNQIKPAVILAIGTDALLKVKGIKSIPIIYLMALNPQTIVSNQENITGVSINISQGKQMALLQKILPSIQNIGLIYDPERSSHFVQKAQDAAEKMGINLISEKAHRSKDVPSLLMGMQGKIEAFWMFPDLSVVTPKTVDFLLYFSFKNKVPILSFSEKYVKTGALVSISMDPFDIGVQAGEMAKEIIGGKKVKDIQQIDARKAVVSINTKIAKKFEINIDEKMIREFQGTINEF